MLWLKQAESSHSDKVTISWKVGRQASSTTLMISACNEQSTRFIANLSKVISSHTTAYLGIKEGLPKRFIGTNGMELVQYLKISMWSAYMVTSSCLTIPRSIYTVAANFFFQKGRANTTQSAVYSKRDSQIFAKGRTKWLSAKAVQWSVCRKLCADFCLFGPNPKAWNGEPSPK